MKPFEDYPGGGLKLLGPTPGSTCRSGYGLHFQRITGQDSCAYCGMSLVDTYEHWLQMSIDHVVPNGVGVALGIGGDWREDCINKVLACAACNAFDNHHKKPTDTVKPESLEEFCTLRDKIFTARNEKIAKRHEEERAFFSERPWEKRISRKAGDK